MHNPLVQYLVGAAIFSIGLMILLSADEIASGLGHFWARWTGKRPRPTARGTNPPPLYRARLLIWRTLGILIVVDGLLWLALATAEVFHLLPHR